MLAAPIVLFCLDLKAIRTFCYLTMARKFTDFNLFNDDQDENEEDSQGNKFRLKTNATLYIVDAGKKMFTNFDDEQDNDFIKCLKCIRSAIRSKIYASEKCICGILLLGTEKTDNPMNFNHIILIQPLAKLGAEHLLKIDKIIQSVEDSSYEKEYGFAPFCLAESFWAASHIFSQQTAHINKNIILFTNDDNPIQNPNDRARVRKSAEDMAGNYILLDLIHLGEKFDVNKFYEEVVQTARNDFTYNIPNPVTEMKDMIERTSKTNYRHVAMAKIPFFISDDFACGVVIRQVVRKVSIPPKVKLSQATNEKVTTKVQLFESETGEVVDDEYLIKAQKLGEKDVAFKKKELDEIAQFGERGLRLMGFKPSSVINYEHFVKPYSFIYPDESEYKGSNVFFTALLKRCIAKQKVAICTYYPRTTSSVRFVALVAQDEVLAPDNSQKTPPGFLVYSLPFAEEVRDTDEKTSGRKRAAPEEVDIARSLIKKLRFQYKPECFPNPKLKSHWISIEALALELKEPENFQDQTIPDYDRISKRTHEIAEKFKENIYPADYDPRDESKPARSRIVRESKPKKDVDVSDVERIVRDGRVENLTVAILKSYLESVEEGKGLSKLKKGDLMEKVCNHLDVPLP